MVQKYIIDKSDLPNLIQGKELALGQGNKFRAFCIEINGELTNGDVIKAMFPHHDIEVNEQKNYVHIFYDSFYTTYPLRWWLEPYKAGDTDGKSD